MFFFDSDIGCKEKLTKNFELFLCNMENKKNNLNSDGRVAFLQGSVCLMWGKSNCFYFFEAESSTVKFLLITYLRKNSCLPAMKKRISNIMSSEHFFFTLEVERLQFTYQSTSQFLKYRTKSVGHLLIDCSYRLNFWQISSGELLASIISNMN